MRFGVFNRVSGVRVAHFRINFEKGQFEGNIVDEAGDIRSLMTGAVKAYVVEGGEPGDDGFLAHLRETLDPAGVDVRHIDDEENIFRAVIDSKRGLIAGREILAEGVEPLPAELFQGVAGSLGRAIRRFSDDLAAKIEELSGKPGSAQQIAEIVDETRRGGALSFEATPALGDAFANVDIDGIEDAFLRRFLEQRVAVLVQLNRMKEAAVDARLLLDRWDDLPGKLAAEFNNIIAIDHMQAGRREAACAIWERLAYDFPGIEPLSRAQVLRNLAWSQEPGAPRAADLLEQACDAFLEGGDRSEAAVTLVHLADALELQSGEESLAALARAAVLLDEGGPIGDVLRAGLEHARAQRLGALGRTSEALESAVAAVEIRRGLVGEEESFEASLALAEGLATGIGDPRAAGLSSERVRFQEMVQTRHREINDLMLRLSNEWSPELADALRTAIDSEEYDDGDVIAARAVILARDPMLSAEERLGALEALHADYDGGRGTGRMLVPVRIAIAGTLEDLKRNERAIGWLQRLLDDAPLTTNMADWLLRLLCEATRWPEAIKLIRREIAIRGESAKRLLSLAETLLKSGEPQDAYFTAKRARGLAGDDTEAAAAQQLIELATDGGATISAGKAPQVVAPVTASALAKKLKEFAKSTAAHSRMDFWRSAKSGKGHDWTARPERQAQLLLSTWLRAAFDGRVEIVEEVGAGAGRLDLLLHLAGGARVVLELKMCGGAYSSNYAGQGGVQLAHYMANLGIGLGYLIVFDGRSRDFGKSVLAEAGVSNGAKLTIEELFVDLRPTWKTDA